MAKERVVLCYPDGHEIDATVSADVRSVSVPVFERFKTHEELVEDYEQWGATSPILFGQLIFHDTGRRRNGVRLFG